MTINWFYSIHFPILKKNKFSASTRWEISQLTAVSFLHVSILSGHRTVNRMSNNVRAISNSFWFLVCWVDHYWLCTGAPLRKKQEYLTSITQHERLSWKKLKTAEDSCANWYRADFISMHVGQNGKRRGGVKAVGRRADMTDGMGSLWRSTWEAERRLLLF